MLLGPLPSPLAVAMRRSLPAMASALGYHSVGMKPRGEFYHCQIGGDVHRTWFRTPQPRRATRWQRKDAFHLEKERWRLEPRPRASLSNAVRYRRSGTPAPRSNGCNSLGVRHPHIAHRNVKHVLFGLRSIAVGCAPGTAGSEKCHSSIRRINLASLKIQFCDCRRIPQANPRFRSRFVGDHCVRIWAGT